MSYTKNVLTNKLRILEENHYYPFGLKHGAYADSKQKYKLADDLEDVARPGYVTKTDYLYKFGAKEWQDELGLNIYDFEARNYDPAFVRTLTMDPLAEQYYSASPYSLFNNNPLRYADPTGMKGEDWIKRKLWDGTHAYYHTTEINSQKEFNNSGLADSGFSYVGKSANRKITNSKNGETGNTASLQLNEDGSYQVTTITAGADNSKHTTSGNVNEASHEIDVTGTYSDGGISHLVISLENSDMNKLEIMSNEVKIVDLNNTIDSIDGEMNASLETQRAAATDGGAGTKGISLFYGFQASKQRTQRGEAEQKRDSLKKVNEKLKKK